MVDTISLTKLLPGFFGENSSNSPNARAVHFGELLKKEGMILAKSRNIFLKLGYEFTKNTLTINFY